MVETNRNCKIYIFNWGYGTFAMARLLSNKPGYEGGEGGLNSGILTWMSASPIINFIPVLGLVLKFDKENTFEVL